MKDSDIKNLIEKLISDRTMMAIKMAGSVSDTVIESLQKSIESLDKVLIAWAQPTSVPYQLCPKCFGDGNLARHSSPPFSTCTTPVCDVCHGAKIIPQFILNPNTPAI